MESREVLVGMIVRVREDRRRPRLEGMLGAVQKAYGAPEYLAVDVQLESGEQELFWFHQLEKGDRNLWTSSAPFHDGSEVPCEP